LRRDLIVVDVDGPGRLEIRGSQTISRSRSGRRVLDDRPSRFTPEVAHVGVVGAGVDALKRARRAALALVDAHQVGVLERALRLERRSDPPQMTGTSGKRCFSFAVTSVAGSS